MTAEHHPEQDAGFRLEVKDATRATGKIAGVLAITALPAWIGFDHVVEPDEAGTFAVLRLLALVPMAACLAALFTDVGRRRPELLVLGIVAAVETAIAFMIPRVETSHSAYALGMSLAIYATAFLLIWPPQYTAATIGITWAALGVALITAPGPVDSAAVTSTSFYLATASLIAYFGQAFRARTARREFDGRVALEREQTRSVELLEELDRQSREDPLTTLANRRAWDEALARECARAARGLGPLSVLLCDVDRLKEVNDRLGHAAGDAVLTAVADVLRVRARDSDLVARIGGDEFGILCAGTDLAGGVALAEEIRGAVGQECEGDVVLARTTVSAGVAQWDGPGDSPDRLLLRADQLLYRAKAQRDVVCFEDPAKTGPTVVE